MIITGIATALQVTGVSNMEAAFKIALKVLLGLLALFVLAVIYMEITSGQTRPFKDDDGNIVPGSIAALEQVELGGVEQWISIRGKNRNNPVLIWLHGGPGSTQMPLAHHQDSELEKEFVVVHWDQRGAGKSNPRGFDENTMSLEQFKADGLELIEHVLNRMEKEKVYLLGHSWGTCLGIELSAENPEYLHAYIGVSQVVDDRRGVEIAYDWLVETAMEKNDRDRKEFLDELGAPPYDHGEYRQLARLVSLYGGNFDLDTWRIALIAFRAPEYRPVDYVRLLGGMSRGGGPLHDEEEMLHFNYIDSVPALEVPVFFLVGANDYNTPARLVEEYYNSLEASHKELVIFEESAHTPFLKEPGPFYQTLIEIKEKTGTGQ